MLFNIFGGITRCDEVAKGLIEAFDQIKPDVPFVVRLDGTNDKEGRALLAEADLPNVHTEATMLGAAAKVVELAELMAILVDRDTKLVRLRASPGARAPSTASTTATTAPNVVAGVTPGKGGQDVEGIPVFNTFHDAVARDRRQHGDDLRAAALRGRLDPRGRGRRHRPDHRDHRGHPRPRRAARLQPPGARQLAAGRARTAPGILSPGKANVGIIPASFFKEGNVGLVSRSGTLTYQIGNELAQRGFGNSSIVGIGGDPVPGSCFIDIIELFEADAETELIVMCGEIGGDAEEEAAEYIAENVSKPVRRLHRRLHRAARQDDGPRRRDRLRLEGHRRGEGRGARGEGRAGGGRPTEVSELAVEMLGLARLGPLVTFLRPGGS